MITLQLLQWYMSHGLEIENIIAFIKHKPVAWFKQFTDEVIAARRKADANTWDATVGNMAKLIGEFRCVSKRKVFFQRTYC